MTGADTQSGVPCSGAGAYLTLQPAVTGLQNLLMKVVPSQEKTGGHGHCEAVAAVRLRARGFSTMLAASEHETAKLCMTGRGLSHSDAPA